MRLKRCAASWAGLVYLLCATTSQAQQSASSLERFIDGVMQRSIVAGETVGATVSLVQNGRLVLSRGYGLADRANARPVEGRQTQFRIGSISKVFVWMAVLQLVEAGKLDLDTDVNTYLRDFSLPTEFTDPITLRHLMTHTPGLEDSVVDLFVSGPRQVGELSTVLAGSIPRRVRLPGNMVSYSNYGAALAGHIVANVSGVGWDDYVEENVFTPLNMRTATTRQPVSHDIESTRAKGYTYSDDVFTERGFSYIPLAPAGSATATALDIAKLMVELLNDKGTSVLSQTSKELLMNGAYLSHPELNGMTMGMYEMSTGDTRAVGHGGNTILFDSLMVLWPQAQMGLFVSVNTMSGIPVAQSLVNTVAEYLGFAERNVALQDVEKPQPYVGEYISARRNHSDFTKIMGLTSTVDVTHDSNTSELIVTDAAGRKRYKQVGEHLFQQVNGHRRIAFTMEGDTAAAVFFSDLPMMGFPRAKGLLSAKSVQLFLLCWLLLALTVLILWPISSLTHRYSATTKGQRLLSTLVFVSMLIMVAFVVQLGTLIQGPYEALFGGLSGVPDLLWYSVGFAVVVLWLFINLYRVWAEGFWWTSRRLHYTVVVFGQCAMVGWLYFWNLVPAPIANL